MVRPKKRDCPDCQQELRPIRIVDATERGSLGKGSVHVDLSYATHYAEASFFSGTIPTEGVVRGLICPQCGRIVLYGEKL